MQWQGGGPAGARPHAVPAVLRPHAQRLAWSSFTTQAGGGHARPTLPRPGGAHQWMVVSASSLLTTLTTSLSPTLQRMVGPGISAYHCRPGEGAKGDGVARAALLKSLSEPQQGTTRACPGVQASGKGCKLAGCSTQVGMYCGSPPLIAIIWRWKPSGAASFQCRVRSYRRMRRLGAAADGGVRSSTAVAQPFRCPMCARPAQGAAIAHSSAGAHAPATRTAHCADIHGDALELRDRRDRAHRCTWRCCRSMPCCRGC